MALADRTPPTAEQYEAYRERFSNWGRWGADDQLGTLNHISAETRRAAAALVVEGRTVSCANPLASTPGPRNPNPAQHFMNVGPGGAMDYIGVSYHGFVNTHIDALCHIYAEDGQLYNGRPASEITSGGARTNSVDHWRAGIVTRGVLYDIPGLRDAPHVALDAPVEGWDLEDAAVKAGVEPAPGDAVLIRSGAGPFYEANPGHRTPFTDPTPGVAGSVLEYLHAHDASLLGWDLQEAAGQDLPVRMPVHQVAIPYMGLPLLDNANLEELTETCAELGRWEFQLVIAPLNVVGGTGSPVNPVAVF
ncbi:MAG: cyclase family protein [Dehalococcoidia bacterium]|jgi:kynurenine formamidase|nr:cyclase family protein [Dehalococcoidia bacterium]